MTLRPLLLFWCMITTPAYAQDGLRGLLRQYEGLPKAEAFRAREADPVAALIALSQSAAEPAWLQLRALDALARFPEARTQSHLEGIVLAARTAPAPAAAHSAAAVYLRTFPREAALRLPELLAAPDPALRVTLFKIALASNEPTLKVAAAAALARTRDPLVTQGLGLPAPVLR